MLILCYTHSIVETIKRMRRRGKFLHIVSNFPMNNRVGYRTKLRARKCQSDQNGPRFIVVKCPLLEKSRPISTGVCGTGSFGLLVL